MQSLGQHRTTMLAIPTANLAGGGQTLFHLNIPTGATTAVPMTMGGHLASKQPTLNLALENANAALAQITKQKPSKAKKAKASNNSASNCSCCSALDKPYVCDWVNCGKRFRQKPHLEAHKNIHTGRRFICEFPDCGKSFVRKYNLQEHQKLHNAHNSNMCNFPDCGKVFSSKYSLARHQNAQHNLSL